MAAIHDFWFHYQTEILIQFAVIASCWIVALLWDLFAPDGLTDKQVRRQVFLICIPVGFAVSMVLWNNMNDPDHDRTAVRVIISLLGSSLAGLGAPFFNRWIAAFIRWKWPGLKLYSSFVAPPP
jgi:hypothetical protein